MEIQRRLGSDIVMAFDELVPTTSTTEQQQQAMERSMRWAKRSRAGFDAGGEHAERAALFGIQQGALDERLAMRLAGSRWGRGRRRCSRRSISRRVSSMPPNPAT